MLDHVSLAVSDAARAKQFYTNALQPLGHRLIRGYDGGFGVGVESESSV